MRRTITNGCVLCMEVLQSIGAPLDAGFRELGVQEVEKVFLKDALIWFTDCSRANSGTGSGIFGLRPNRSFSFPLGKFATVFQIEIYAILQCACENIRRAYKNKRILIFSDSQAALKALSCSKVTSELVAEGLDALSALASIE